MRRAAAVDALVVEHLPVDTVATRFGTNSENLDHLASERGVKPRYNINGTDYYDIKDFGDVLICGGVYDGVHGGVMHGDLKQLVSNCP